MASNLSDVKINRGRQFEVDIAKFFAIPFMICIHFYELFGGFDFANKVPDSFFRNAIEIIGGPFAAPVFMFSMGIGMIYTRHDSPNDFIRRGGKLVLIGYLLNFFRQTLLQLIGLAMGIDSELDIIDGLLSVDILPFAGMTFLAVGVMRKLKFSAIQICAVSFLMQTAGIWSTKLHMNPGVVQNLLGLLIPTGKMTSFPLTLWLVYPSLGMVFGEVLMKCTDKDKMYRRLMIYSTVFFAAFTGGLMYIGYDIRNIYALYRDTYYHHNIIATLWITPLLLSSLGIVNYSCRKLKNTRVRSFIRYCSENLNTIYIIQWLIIAYSFAVSILLGIEKTCSPFVIISGGIIVTGISIMISVPFARRKREKNRRRTTYEQ